MSTLYIAPGACSLASHIVVRELDLPIHIETVALRTSESPIHRINPLGRVPALQVEEGGVLTENSAVLPYLADLKPGTSLFARPARWSARRSRAGSATWPPKCTPPPSAR